MTLSLRQRLLLVVMLPAVVLATVVASLYVARSTQAVEDALGDRGLAIVSFLGPAAEYGVISGNRASLSSLLQAVLEQRDVSAVAIYDRDGETLAVSGRLRLAAPTRIMEVQAAQIIAHDDNRLSLAAPVLTAAMMVDDIALPGFDDTGGSQGDQIGWVYVELDTFPLDNAKRVILLTALSLVLIGLAFTAWLAIRMAHAVSAPITDLAEALGGVANGRLNVAVRDDASINELRVLQGGFNVMAQAISEAHQNLQSRVDEATAQLAHQALHDPLTGLPNRRAFEQALELSVGASRRAGDRDTLCFIDLDRFKIVNDTVGHGAGDELLRRIATLISTRVRTDDLICRIGGDEFALILRGCGAEEARRIAENLREAIASLRFSWDGRRFTVGASIGLMRIDGSTHSASDVLVAADLACYAAKKSGRNRVVDHEAVHSGARGDSARQLENTTVFESVPYERLRLYRQSILPVLASTPTPWFEVLLRVDGENDQAEAISKLLTLLDDSRGGLALDIWVAGNACAHAGAIALESTGTSPHMALNITRDSLTRSVEYIEGLFEATKAYGVDSANVVLEFPAALADQWPKEAISFVENAHGRGFRIGLERLDGGSSAQLNHLRPDYVKISLKTLTESFGMEAGCNLAQALCGMAAALSIITIATEVEDPLLRDALKDYGFDFAQGCALAAPEPLQTEKVSA